MVGLLTIGQELAGALNGIQRSPILIHRLEDPQCPTGRTHGRESPGQAHGLGTSVPKSFAVFTRFHDTIHEPLAFDRQDREHGVQLDCRSRDLHALLGERNSDDDNGGGTPTQR